jgi:hypothetical protein
VCAQIACGRAHINAELSPQFFRPRVKVLVEDVDEEKTQSLHCELTRERVSKAVRASRQ